MGRKDGDVTPFVEYFCVGMADAFGKVRARAKEAAISATLDQTPALRTLSPQQRHVLGLFLRSKIVSAKDVAAFFNCSSRSAAALCGKWLTAGFLAIENPSTKARTYHLADAFESLVVSQAGGSPGGAGQKSKTRIRRKKK
jgi:hypothetical protein